MGHIFVWSSISQHKSHSKLLQQQLHTTQPHVHYAWLQKSTIWWLIVTSRNYPYSLIIVGRSETKYVACLWRLWFVCEQCTDALYLQQIDCNNSKTACLLACFLHSYLLRSVHICIIPCLSVYSNLTTEIHLSTWHNSSWLNRNQYASH